MPSQTTHNPVLHTRDSLWTLLSTPVNRPGQTNTSSLDHYELQTRKKRSLSQSTADTQLANERLESGAFRIVIDRPDSAPRSENSFLSFPGIEVPIPHYRLGTPRFSARGTPFFHNSVYTRSSAGPEAESSVLTPGEYEKIFPKPPGIEAHAVISRRHSHQSPQSHIYTAQTSGPSSVIGQQLQASRLYQPNQPITLDIFESLARNPNDPAIVKYSPINGDIIAASPARIIAQITSERFLDYELLSDFFLTVRSYLTTSDLLAYLLARFEWAINRFDDNGCVIRVRAFAALRHWILNYFSYDFVTDRELRVQFCDRLNQLTRLVKSRANYGASEMKLIADLKKCWNGRCLVYWDSPVNAAEGQPEVDIQPGGILGSRDSRLVHQSQLRSSASLPPALTVNPAQVTAGATSISTWYSVVMDNGESRAQGHDRQSSTGTARSLPISPTSEQSNQVLSCSIPTKGLKKTMPYANKALGIHPIPYDSEGRRICPAATSSLSNEPARPVGVHRRSGSFSDAARDKRAPLSSEVPTTSEAIAQELSYGNSMLRGFVVSPGIPFVTVVPSTPIAELPQVLSMAASSTQGSEAASNRRLITQSNPAVKGIIGNIRRALSSKHNGPSGSANGVAAGKSVTLPVNVTYNGSGSGPLDSLRTQSRIDLLAADVYDAFQKATIMAEPSTAIVPAVPSHGASSNHEPGTTDKDSAPPQSSRQVSSIAADSHQYLMPEPLRPDLSRLTSGVTDSSQSIVIMDDTGWNIPNMTDLRIPRVPIPRQGDLAVASKPAVKPERTSSQPEAHDGTQGSQPPISPLTHSGSTDIPLAPDTRPISSSDIASPTRPSMHARKTSTGTISLSLRRYASFQSTFGKHAAGGSVDMKIPSDSLKSVAKEAPARMLRRRPGGDLRANQNVHDMEATPRPKSAGSITTFSESVRSSQMLGFGEKIARTFAGRKSPEEAIYGVEPSELGARRDNIPSYVRTHSSLHAKRHPSFEAAVAEFAQIPDDEEGGLEATLLKLEGKYKSPVQSPKPQLSDLGANSSRENSQSARGPGQAETRTDGQILVEETAVESDPTTPTVEHEEHISRVMVSDDADEAPPVQPPPEVSRGVVISTVYAESEDSYNSVPILARLGEESNPSIAQAKDTVLTHSGEIKINVSENRRKLKRGSLAPTMTTDSFLLDENDEFLSDVESEMSIETIDGNSKTSQWLTQTAQSTQEPKRENTILISHNHPPSPPMTMENALSITSQAKQAHDQRKPPTPDPSPVSQHVEPNILVAKPSDLMEAKHIPFILGCDSELLAQQFTILEKEALKEIDWRDLVDLRWHDTTTSPTNWVNYLATHDPLGVDLVTARFNIMVKWALSEIVMTRNLEERALTIVKYIHIAHQARKIHNYATVFQMTIALTSTDCTRLSKTWDAVPTAEKEILQDLEMLVSPRRNFHNLRSEMEKANADEGCIPVIGKF